MKEHVRLLSSVFVFGLILFSAGCGGGGGGDDDDGSAAGNAAGSAPQSISGRSIRLFDNTGSENRVEFAATGNQFVEPIQLPGQAPRSGTYAYASSGSTATLTLIDSSADEIRAFTLAFSTSEAGSYQVSSNKGATSAGSFNLVASLPPPPATGTGGEPAPGPDNGSGTDPNSGGGPPSPIGEGGLDNRMLRMIRSTGQTHTYTFTGNQFVDSDPPEQGTGTYTFTRSGAQAALILHYTGSTGPVSLAGDRHDLQLTFTSETSGSYSSSYTVSDGTVIPQEGLFEVIK